VLADLGAALKPVRFPSSYEAAVGLGFAAMGAEIAAAHREYYPARASEYGPELGGMIQRAYELSPLDIADAARARRNFSGEVNRLWKDIDLLLVPAMPMTVPPVERMTPEGLDLAFMAEMVRFTKAFDLTGSPTITLPGGFTKNGLPIGFQLVGPHLSEDVLCRAGHAFQQATNWHTHHPDLP
jgi:amidase